jgi:molybdopterin molybdotransferase
MLSLEQAQFRILALVHSLGSESVPLRQAVGRFLSQPVSAGIDLPPFDNSAMDGYAVRAEDLQNASPESPVRLQLIGAAAAGHDLKKSLSKGQCIRLFTGSRLPDGADAVIMQEDAAVDPARAEHPAMLASVKPWENVRFRGEDVKRGDYIAQTGDRLAIAQAAALAAVGCAEVVVGQQPTLGLIATGNELREAGEVLESSQLYESNRTALAALAAHCGAKPRLYPLTPDSLTATQQALTTAFRECDAVVTTGGVSVGELDFVKPAFEELGGSLEFWRVAIKPGKPFAFGEYQRKLLFGLPGNPVSAFVTFLLLVRPALLKVQGARDIQLPATPGIMAETLRNPGDRRHFVRVRVDASGQVRPSGVQASHVLLSLARANGLVDVPAETVMPIGTQVPVLRWE